jgi:hypothetical protein
MAVAVHILSLNQGTTPNKLLALLNAAITLLSHGSNLQSGKVFLNDLSI